MIELNCYHRSFYYILSLIVDNCMLLYIYILWFGVNMTIKKNDDIKLYIEAMTNEGSGVGHYDGMAVFVNGAVAGDSVVAHIIKVSKNYCVGIVKQIIEPSKDRIEYDCTVADKCGGCSFRNMTYSLELEYKKNRVQDAVKRIGHLDLKVDNIIGADDVNHYRNKAQYPVQIVNGELNAGFYAYKSHRIIPCTDCLLQSENFNKCLEVFKKWVKKADITSFDEKTGKGLLRHIYLREGFATGEIMVCAVINGKNLPMSDYLISELVKIDGVKSICMNVNTKNTNVILSNDTRVLWGSDTITDELLGKKFVISPNSFYQVNHNQCEKLYKKAMEYANLNGDETLLDMYCGIGTIGLTMAQNVSNLVGIEVVQQAIDNAKINAKINNVKNAQFYCADAFEGAKILEDKNIKPDVILLDPPRKGCQKELFDVIERMNPKKIVYVSCDSATLARDLEILDKKNFKAVKLSAVDMFPRTPHVEAVCLIENGNI